MAVVVGRVVVVVHEVPAAPVVDVAVAVVVDPVRPAARAVLTLVDPDVLSEIGMRHVDTGVDDRDRDARTAGRDRPRLLGVDVRVRSPCAEVDRLARVVEAPLLRERRIVRRHVGRVEDEVRLRVRDARVLLEGADRPLRIRRAHRDDGAVDLGEMLHGPGAHCTEHAGPPLGGDVALEADDDRARHRGGSLGRVLATVRRACNGSGGERRGQSGGEENASCWALTHGVRAQRPARAERSALSERRAEPPNRHPSRECLAPPEPARTGPGEDEEWCFSRW